MTDTIETGPDMASPAFLERRSTARRRALKGAKLSFNNGYGAFECVVRNMSDGGARLVLDETSVVPRLVSLQVSGENAGRPATVRWRKTNAMGVSLD